MAAFSTDFSEKLIEAAQAVLENDVESVDAKRTVLYLSLLSCEITLKALLEKSGKTVQEIRRLSHDLERLLDELGHCKVEIDIANGNYKWVSATRLNSKVIKIDNNESTVGVILSGESQGASKYPNQIRYGDRLYHFPPEAVLNVAKVILRWAIDKWDRIRK